MVKLACLLERALNAT